MVWLKKGENDTKFWVAMCNTVRYQAASKLSSVVACDCNFCIAAAAVDDGSLHCTNSLSETDAKSQFFALLLSALLANPSHDKSRIFQKFKAIFAKDRTEQRLFTHFGRLAARKHSANVQRPRIMCKASAWHTLSTLDCECEAPSFSSALTGPGTRERMTSHQSEKRSEMRFDRRRHLAAISLQAVLQRSPRGTPSHTRTDL